MMVSKGIICHAFCMPKGHFVRTPEHCANIAKANKGLKRSIETRERISRAKSGLARSIESRQKQSLAKKGKPSGRIWTEELSANMSAGRKGKSGKLKHYGVSNEEYERQMALGNKWCVYRKHFVPSSDGFVSRTAVCSGCKSEYARMNSLKNIFGVDQEWYESKLKEQGGACAICKIRDCLSTGKKHFAIDHCHTSGHIRGLLCSRCNTALERLDMIPNWCINAAAYLERYAVAGPDARVYRKRDREYRRKVIGATAESEPAVSAASGNLNYRNEHDGSATEGFSDTAAHTLRERRATTRRASSHSEITGNDRVASGCGYTIVQCVMRGTAQERMQG